MTELQGVDIDIEISLKEYGLAWKEEKNEYYFYYGIERGLNDCNSYEYILFDWTAFNKDINVYHEFSWVDWEQVFSFIGLSKEDFDSMPLPHKINDIKNYYGFENVFGSSYYGGITYNQIIEHNIKE